MDQQSDFKTALDELRPLLARDNPIFEAFRNAAVSWNRTIDHNSTPVPASLKYDMPVYLGDAVAMYERCSTDSRSKYHPAFLFNESSRHIVDLRDAVCRIQERFPDPASEEHKAAIAMSTAIEKVIIAAKPFQSVAKSEDGKIRVFGYLGGMVARELGEYKKDEDGCTQFYGCAVIEIGIENLRHLQEGNGLRNYQDRLDKNIPLDFCIIFHDGSPHAFHYKGRKKGGRPGEFHDQLSEAVTPVRLIVGAPNDPKAIALAEANLIKMTLEFEKSRPAFIGSAEEIQSRTNTTKAPIIVWSEFS